MATPTIRQSLRSPSVTDNGSGGYVATVTVTTTSSQVDDWLIAVHQTAFRADAQLIAPTTSQGGITTWTLIDDVFQTGTSPGVKMRAWMARVTTAGNKTVAITCAATSDTNFLGVFVVVGADPTTPIDGTPFGAFGTTGTQALGPVTTTSSDALLVGAWGAYSGGIDHTAVSGGATATNGLLQYKGSSNNSTFMFAQELTSAGSNSRTPTLTGGPSTGWAGLLFALKAGSQELTALGISTGIAFGSHTLTPGDVGLVTTGISHPTTFGSQTLSTSYDLTATSIPSATAFGAAFIHGGLGATGIPSAEAFGTAVLTRGAVTLTATGIPHTHTFGTAVLQGSVLVVTGIPSVLAFGTPTLTPGPVTLTATGISHSHPLGIATLIQVVTALTTEIVVRPKPKVSYDLVMTARIPQPAGPPIFMELESLPWTDITYGQKLSAPDTLDATIKTSSLTEGMKQRLRKPSEMPTELWLHRNGKRVFAGPIIGGSMNGEDLTLNANGILHYLQWMYIRNDMVFNHEQFSIVKSIIDQWQVIDYGHFGIETPSVGYSGIGRTVTFVRNELHIVYDTIMDMSKSLDGFDVNINPVSRNLELYSPKRGINRSTGSEAVIFDDRNVTDTNIAFSLGVKDVATVVAGSGTGSGQNQDKTYWSAYRNINGEKRFGRVGNVASFRNVSSQEHNDDLTDGLLGSRSETLWIPGPNVRVTTDSDLDSYDVGDTVSYHLHNELDISGAFRLLSRRIRVDENNNESVSVSFV